ncbi:MAG: HD domain-containing phosphohydrolase [Bryobacteraceae bacterium]
MPTGKQRLRILVVEDESPIRMVLGEALGQAGYETAQAANAMDALGLLARGRFDLVLSDVRMPGMSGLELLEAIRRRHPGVGVLLLTGCEDVGTAVTAMKSGALDYALKPFQLPDLFATVERAAAKHRGILEHERHVHDLEEEVDQRGAELKDALERLQGASETTLEALVAALDAREHETQAHSKRVSEYALLLARRLGIGRGELELIRRGAMLHDIGKIGISDNILLKPSQLTDEEWVEMRKHPEIGRWILEGVESLRPASPIVLSHHERYDGTGYPQHLRGEQIPLGARIFAVADSFDAITSDRPYRKGAPYRDAREEIAGGSGTQFDPVVVGHFLAIPPEEWQQIRRRVGAAKPSPAAEWSELVHGRR